MQLDFPEAALDKEVGCLDKVTLADIQAAVVDTLLKIYVKNRQLSTKLPFRNYFRTLFAR